MTNQVSQVMSRVRFVVLLEVWDGEGHVQVPDVLHRHHLVELLCGGNQESGSDGSTAQGSEVMKQNHQPHSQVQTDLELLLLERMLRELRDGHILVLHLSKQLDHHGRELIYRFCTPTSK